MIEKEHFYHGAAILYLLEDGRCKGIKRCGQGGYLVNDDRYVYPKYTTKPRTPWRFSFGPAEYAELHKQAASHSHTVIPLICGGDGICAITLEQCDKLLGGKEGWISVRRRFNECYAVAGSVGELNRKVPRNIWPELLFDTTLVR